MNDDQLPELPHELKSLAADLEALAPASGDLSRDELMYRAGWAACAASAADHPARLALAQGKTFQSRGLSWLWPMSTAGLLLVSATLGVALATRTPDVQVVYIERSKVSPAAAQNAKQPADRRTIAPQDEVVAASDSHSSSARLVNPPQFGPGREYLSLRQRVLAFGVDVLQSRAAPVSPDDEATISDSRYGTLLGQLRGG
jgi:hypothetical protein